MIFQAFECCLVYLISFAVISAFKDKSINWLLTMNQFFH